MSDNTLLFLLVLGFIAAAAKVAYDVGYRRGQDDLLNPPHLRPMTEDERNRMLMRLTLPRWRRVLGWAVIAAPGVLFWVLLFAAIRHGGSGWVILLAAVASIVALAMGAWLSEWFWRPYRRAQEGARRARASGDKGEHV